MREFSIRKLVVSCIAIGATFVAIVSHLIMGLTLLVEPYGVEFGIIIATYAQVGVATVFFALNIIALFVFTQKASKGLGIASLSITLAITLTCLALSAVAMYTVPADVSDYFVSLCLKWAVIFMISACCFVAYFVCSWYVPDRTLGSQVDTVNIVEEEGVASPQVDEEPATVENKEAVASNPFSDIHIEACAMMFRKDIPSKKYLFLRDALSRADESKYAQICATPTKDPTTVMLFSIFLGGLGVDRFYIGDIGLGIAKLLLNTFTLGIWWALDIYFCRKKAAENNLASILKSISD